VAASGRQATGTAGAGTPEPSEVRWLDDTEQATWRAFLWGSQLLWEALDHQLQRDAGMPHAYYVVLAMLSEAPDRTMSMSELARVARYTPSRLSHAVSRLEEVGWVRRTRHPTDRRTTLAVLTNAGFEVLVGVAPGHVAEVRRVMFDRLTRDQVCDLGTVFARIQQELEAESGRG
jgi:DNA-binding MarR family transcriptional regulator